MASCCRASNGDEIKGAVDISNSCGDTIQVKDLVAAAFGGSGGSLDDMNPTSADDNTTWRYTGLTIRLSIVYDKEGAPAA